MSEKSEEPNLMLKFQNSEELNLMLKIDKIVDKIAERNEFRRVPAELYELMTVKINNMNLLDLKSCKSTLEEIYAVLSKYFPDYLEEEEINMN